MPTLSALRSRVRLDPVVATTTVISDANINSLLNEGALDMADIADAFILSAQWDSAVSTQTYVLSGASPKVTGFLDIYTPAGGLVYTDADGVKRTAPHDFRMTSEDWLNKNVPGWQDDDASDDLQAAYLSYDSSGYLLMGVYPKSETLITNAYKLYYKSRGTDMDGDTKYPWTNSTTVLTHTEPYQKGIAYYALWQIHSLITRKLDEADRHRQMYLLEAQKLKAAQERLFKGELRGSYDDAQVVADMSFGRL
jgi:hypothetical protein